MSIDSIYEGIIAKLTNQGKILDISKKLLSLKNNEERVLNAYEIINSLKVFPEVIEVTKTQKVSTQYRSHGNNYFQKSENHKALQYYNLSLLHAPLQSESYSLALANRSAVFYCLNMYEECLIDIEQVFSSVYPDKLKQKLFRRKNLCQEALKKKTITKENKYEVNEILNFSSSKEKNLSTYSCASSKLEVVFNEKMGRHVIAKEDIRVGEILAQEEPYLSVLLKSQYLVCCSYCLSRSLNLVPCKSCCFALYCSTNCREKAFKEYHVIECPLMATLVHMEFTKLELLALKIMIKARFDHICWNDLFKTIEEAEATVNTNHWGHVKIDDKWQYDSKYYSSIHTLASNVEKRSISDIFQKAVTAAVFLHLLTVATDFIHSINVEESEAIRKCVAGMLLLHIMTSPTNMHGISCNVQSADGNYVDVLSIASAPYAFHSLLNHSCSPNVTRISKLGTAQMTLIALRPIKKGMQIFDNYGSHHALESRLSRQKNLKFQYKFDCMCEACSDNWPTYLQMSPKNLPNTIRKIKENLLTTDAIEKLKKGNITMALKLYKPLCELAEILDPYMPCIELSDCQEALKQCIVIFEGLLPYGFDNMVEWNAIPD